MHLESVLPLELLITPHFLTCMEEMAQIIEPLVRPPSAPSFSCSVSLILSCVL